MNTLKQILMLCLLMSLAVVTTGTAQITSAQSGNWSDVNTWVGGVVPSSGDVIIADGHTVTIDQNVSIANLTVGGGTSGVLTFDGVASRSVAVSGNITVSAGGMFIVQSLLSPTGDIAISSNIITNVSSTTGIIVGMSITNAAIPVSTTITAFDASSITLSQVATATAAGATLAIGAATNTLSIGGDLTINNTATFDMSRGTSTTVCNVTFNKSGNQTISGTTPTLVRFRGITLSKGAIGNKVISSVDASAAGSSLIFPSSTGTWEQTAGTFTASSTINTAATTGISIVTNGNWNQNLSNLSIAGTLTVNTSGTVTIGGQGTGVDYKLDLATTGAVANLTAGTININGYFTTATTKATVNMTGVNINVDASYLTLAATQAFGVNNAGTLLTFNAGTVTILNPSPVSLAANEFNVAGGFKPTGTAKVVIGKGATTGSSPNGGFKLGGAGLPFLNNLEINSGSTGASLTAIGTVSGTLTLTSGTFTTTAVLTLASGATISRSGGSLSATPTFGATTNITYTSPSPAAAITTGVECPSSVNNLTIDNSSGVLLGGSKTITGTLTLTSGILSLGSNHLTISAFSGTPSATAMVVAEGAGELRKSFSANGSFTFPVGDNTGTAEYSPVTINLTAAGYSSAYVGVNLANSKESNNTSSTDYINRYWTVTSSGLTTPSYSATFSYLQADVVGTETNLIGGKYDGSWSLLAAVNDVANTFTGSGLSTFSTFTAGENSAMPVEIVSFTASPKQHSVELQWKTAIELNNRGFEIEKNVNGSWISVGYVEGNGTSNSEHAYSFVDANVSGKMQYRLKQSDNDGKIRYSSVVEAVVVLTAEDYLLTQNYPNPFNPTTTFSFAMKNQEQVNVVVYNMLGQVVTTLFNGIAQPNELYTLKFNGKDLSSGIYFYSLRSASRNEVKKMLLTK